MRIINLPTLLNFVEPFFKENILLSRKSLDSFMWQAVLDMMSLRITLKKELLKLFFRYGSYNVLPVPLFTLQLKIRLCISDPI